MNSYKPDCIEVDEAGRLQLPPELASRYAIRPGSRIRVNENQSNLFIRVPSRLAKLYIEPTNQCNLNCAAAQSYELPWLFALQ